jgi:hypothetical protein
MIVDNDWISISIYSSATFLFNLRQYPKPSGNTSLMVGILETLGS